MSEINSFKNQYALHFVGIGGIGMSGIAEVFIRQGHRVSGSDLQTSESIEKLKHLGAQVFVGHDARNVLDLTPKPQAVVVSSAVRAGNPELVSARMLGIPIIRRAEMLGEVMRGKRGIAVAGTHGKTTTSSMIAHILIEAKFDPTVVVGGKVELIGGNAKLGSSDWMVAEADESDGSFQMLPFTWGVVTNIDLDHMDYFKTEEVLKREFLSFIQKVPFYGKVWVCGDDFRVQQLFPNMSKPVATYGMGAHNSLQAKMLQGSTFEVVKRDVSTGEAHRLGEVCLGVLGKHNVLNALAAIGLSLELGVSFEVIRYALSTFRSVKRRFETKWLDEKQNIRVVDDYGHHPTEVRAVLETARLLNPKKLRVVFQPHRYTRTEQSWNEFVNCFDEADELVLLPIYSANESPIEGITHLELAKSIELSWQKKGLKKKIHCVNSLSESAQWILKEVQPGDFILTLGAGSITQVGPMLVDQLNAKARA